MSNISSRSGQPPSSPDEQNSSSSASTTPVAEPRLNLSRSMSRSSNWSNLDTPQHHNIGTSYFPSFSSSNRPSSPTARRSNQPNFSRNVSTSSSRRRGVRSTSVSKNRRDESGLLSEEDEENEDSDEVRDEEQDRRDGGDPDAEDVSEEGEEDPITLKDRQSLINVEHPFGLPIWKPALYKKSRTVTRNADQALHSVPTAQARPLLLGNIAWTVFFGWWLAIDCILLSFLLYLVPKGGKSYSNLVFGLGWYLFWPFGKYVAGDMPNHQDEEARPSDAHPRDSPVRVRDMAFADSSSSSPPSSSSAGTIKARNGGHQQSVSWVPMPQPVESTSLLSHAAGSQPHQKSYGAIPVDSKSSDRAGLGEDGLGKVCFWIILALAIAPLMLAVSLICWGGIITIPMAKLNWAILEHLFRHPSSIRFCAAPPALVIATPPSEIEEEHGIREEDEEADDRADAERPPQEPRPAFAIKQQVLAEGEAAPAGSPAGTVLLCIYEAIGWQYYKYTVGGVNILFVNLLPVVFFVIFDNFVLLRITEKMERRGDEIPAFLAFIASRALIFLLSLLSVIPLSYFIGMAVASISAQSSIGMGAVINATFGSIIEVILYGIALTEGRGRLVEGSIVGSVLAGVLLMPGASMCSGALKKKEQKFNAKSAGVTSTMLIMAIIGTLTPTMFYQTYGNFQLICEGCPDDLSGLASLSKPWTCQHCFYEHPEPIDDPFYQASVRSLTYFCGTILVLSYVIGLWFSLRTHASQIWQNPQQLLQPLDQPSNRLSLYQRILPPRSHTEHGSIRRKPSSITIPSRSVTPAPRSAQEASDGSRTAQQQQHVHYASSTASTSPVIQRRTSYANLNQTAPGLTPLIETVDHAIKDTGIRPTQLSTDEFTRAVAVATVSALRHQQHVLPQGRPRAGTDLEDHGGGHGGHDAPSWSRTTSASVLLACTALYAIIAEILVDVVDVVLEGSGIDEKFLGITLFALVPNTTEFMNAMAFALNGNIALSMEIGSAYALQVCLLQIPAMLAFSAIFRGDMMGSIANTFPLLFPRWDVLAIILSVFLMTYTYIEAKSNYHRGSMLVLSYLVLAAGFYFAPDRPNEIDEGFRPLMASSSRSAILRPLQKTFRSLFSV